MREPLATDDLNLEEILNSHNLDLDSMNDFDLQSPDKAHERFKSQQNPQHWTTDYFFWEIY